MPWTYAQLKAADANLDPPVSDPSQAAEAVKLLSETKTGQAFKWKAAKRVARESATGDWARIVSRSRLKAASPPVSIEDFAILAAINAVESTDDDTIDPSDPGSWQAWQNGLGALEGVGDLHADTVARLNGLTTVVVLLFDDPPPDSGHIQTARSQP